MKFTIYCCEHIESGKRYVGQTRQRLSERWRVHIAMAGKSSGRFSPEIAKYGRSAFVVWTIEEASTSHDANAAERRWIARYKTTDPAKGYNTSAGVFAVRKRRPLEVVQLNRMARSRRFDSGGGL